MLPDKADSRTLEKIHTAAEKLVEFTHKKFSLKLDYSEESLVLLDDLIILFFKWHKPHYYTVASVIGSYFGEVIIRHMGGKWLKDLSIKKVGKAKLLVHPITKAKTRLAEGVLSSLTYFYHHIKLTATGDTKFARDYDKIQGYYAALRAQGQDEVLLKRISALAEKKYVREEAAELLGRLGDETIVPSLLALLGQPESAYYAAIVFQGLPSPKAYAPIAKLLKESRKPAVKMQAALALGSIRDERAIPALMRLLKQKNESLNYYGALALGKIGGAKTLNALLEAMVKSPHDKLIYIIEALSYLQDNRAVPALIEALFSQHNEVREAALKALQFIPDERSVPTVLKLLKDPSSNMRILAAYALAHLRDNKKIVEYIKPLMKDEAHLVRQHAAQIIFWLENGIPPAKCV